MKSSAFVLGLASLFLVAPLTQAQRPKRGQVAPPSTVVRPAPEFSWSSITGKVRRLRDLRGQPVVLIFATRPSDKIFKKQVKEITRRYDDLSTERTLFFVAFTKESGLITGSNVPFVVLPDPGAVADEYRVGDFGIAIIGPDGNLDYATDRVVTGRRILDVVINSYVPQAQNRRAP